MSENKQLILFTTVGCTLCNKAKIELWPVLSEFGLTLVEYDIIDSEVLTPLLATRIPAIALNSDLLDAHYLDGLVDSLPVNQSSELASESPEIPPQLAEQMMCWPFAAADVSAWIKSLKSL